MARRRSLLLAAAASVMAAACSGGTDASADASSDAGAAPEAVAEYPDAQKRLLDRLAAAPRPVENSAMPPRHLDADAFPDALVDRTRIVSGGPPPDGIPAIDAPRFEAVGDVDWLDRTEAVIAIEVGGVARAYPVRILIRHEIVNDAIGDRPVTVTYCPLCNSAIAYDRRVGGRVLDFGTSGALYQSALVMYDRQTESLWTHFDGRSVVGTLVGTELDLIPAATVSWEDFATAHPDADVLSQDLGFGFEYGSTLTYSNYDQRDGPAAGFFSGEIDDRLDAMERVVGVAAGGEQIAIALHDLSRDRVVTAEVGGVAVVALWEPGLASSLHATTVAGGDDIGATGVFVLDDGQQLAATDDGFAATDGTSYDILGRAISGPRAGEQLERVTHVDTFWFAWSTYHPGTAVVAD